MWETQVRFLGQEDPLEKTMIAHSNIFAWEIPRTEESGGLLSMVLQSQTGLSDQLSLFTFLRNILLRRFSRDKEAAWFLFAAYNKMQGEGDKLGEECINKKKPRGDDLENLQLLQTAKTATFRRFTVRNVRSKEKLRVWISNVQIVFTKD